MKKFIVALLALFALALTVAPAAFAETDCEAKICDLAKQNEKVTQAKCVVWQRNAIVAIKTENFATKSDYSKFVKQLTDEVTAQCEVDRVVVSRNPKVMKQVQTIAELQGEEREQAIAQLLKELARLRPRPIDIPKITFGQ